MENTRKGEYTEIKVMAYQLSAITKAIEFSKKFIAINNGGVIANGAITLLESSLNIYLGYQLKEAEKLCGQFVPTVVEAVTEPELTTA